MLTVDLEKQLIKNKSRRMRHEESVLAQQQLLDDQIDRIIETNNEKYQKELYDTLGFDHKLVRAAEITSLRRKIASLDAHRVFDISEIKATCMAYGLRFLPTSLYKGTVPVDLGAHVEAFKRKAPEKAYQEYNYTDKDPTWEFRIAAPARSFQLEKRPKGPLLFARLDNHTWYLVHKWGTNLSKLRLIPNIFRRAYNRNNWDNWKNWDEKFSD